jgi:hypothetical protein
MTAARDELFRLVESLPEDRIAGLLADARRRVELQAPRTGGEWPPASFGSIKSAKNGRTDNARRIDEFLAEGFGRPRS